MHVMPRDRGKQSITSHTVTSRRLIDLFFFIYFMGLVLSTPRIFPFFPPSDIMDPRHQSSAMCTIMLGGEDTHPWSATNVGNPILATIPVDWYKFLKLQ